MPVTKKKPRRKKKTPRSRRLPGADTGKTINGNPIRSIKVSELMGADYNPRQIKPKNLGGLKASVGTFGLVQAIVWNIRTQRLVGGHQRLDTLDPESETEVVVVDLDRDQEKALNLALNNRNIQGEWTVELAKVIKGLEVRIPDLAQDLRLPELYVQVPSFSGGRDDLPPEPGAPPPTTPEGQIPDAEDPPKEPKSTPGRVYKLGPHRLLCGDSTKRQQVRKLMGKLRADMMFTDPPYGVVYKAKGNKKNAIRGDLTQAAIPLSFAAAIENVLNEDARVYVCGGSGNFAMYAGLFDHYLQAQPHIIIWIKTPFVLRPNNYHSQFEIIYWGWRGKGGGSKHWYGDRKDSDVWNVRHDSDRVHPTQKPIELCEKAIRNSCPPDGIVFEPFCGSGATLIAAERLGRRCYAVELDPSWCDVIRKRWGAWCRANDQNPGKDAL